MNFNSRLGTNENPLFLKMVWLKWTSDELWILNKGTSGLWGTLKNIPRCRKKNSVFMDFRSFFSHPSFRPPGTLVQSVFSGLCLPSPIQRGWEIKAQQDVTGAHGRRVPTWGVGFLWSGAPITRKVMSQVACLCEDLLISLLPWCCVSILNAQCPPPSPQHVVGGDQNVSLRAEDWDSDLPFSFLFLNNYLFIYFWLCGSPVLCAGFL